MTCSACGTENRPGARFCNECGAALAVACAACGQTNPPGSRFCDACGQALGTSPSPGGTAPSTAPQPQAHRAQTVPTGDVLEGERKQVTILFADVVGSTALIQGRDDEGAQRLLDGAVQHMVDAVHQYEGTVSRRMGDGLMAMFGAPVAHEDHAVRACYAALAMLDAARAYADEARRTLGVAIQIRVGLNSGGVIVRLIANDRHLDYTAMGETVHLASRMEQLAAPDTVLLSPATRALAEGFVEVRGLGGREVKGIAQPVEVYELVGVGAARSRLQAVAGRGLTPFVGRDDERAAIDRALARAQAGQGQLVALVAEAGVGKSRLVWEATRSERALGCRILQTGAVSYGQTTTWLPVIDLLKSYFQIDSRDDQAAMREKVNAGLIGLDPALEPTLPAFLALLDLPVDPEASPVEAAWVQRDPAQRRRAILDAVQQLLLRESRRQPLLLVFEDLHWIDSETQALLDSLVDILPTARVMLLVNYRPEYSHGWGNKSYYTQLRVDPLVAESAEALLGALVGSDASLQPLVPLLVQRTEGTPLFLEESVRSLIEIGALAGERGAYRLARPVAEIQVPATVQAVLAARIDRLPPDEKRLLQTASVVGKDVPFRVLQAVAALPEAALQASLARLQSAEMLYPVTLFPEQEHTFKHALTHDVAYGSLLQERRKRLHARIVAAIEAEYGDRLGEHVERLAHHALRAESWEQAARYSRLAGQRATARSAYREAVPAFEQALLALSHLPRRQQTMEESIDIRLDLRNGLFALARFEPIHGHLIAALDEAVEMGDRARESWVYTRLSSDAANCGDSIEAIRYGRLARAIADDLGDSTLQVVAMFAVAVAHSYHGDERAAIEECRAMIAMLEGPLGRDTFRQPGFQKMLGEMVLCHALAELGRFQEGLDPVLSAATLEEVMSQPYTMQSVLRAAGSTYLLAGDLATARPLLEGSLALCRAWAIDNATELMSAMLGHLEVMEGRIVEGLVRLEQSVRVTESIGHIAHLVRPLIWLGEAQLRNGQPALARQTVMRALDAATHAHHRGRLADARRILGEIAASDAPANTEEAEGCYREALSLAEELGMRPLQAHCHLGLGKLYRRVGRDDEARTELATAVAMLREMGMLFWLPEAEAELTLLS